MFDASEEARRGSSRSRRAMLRMENIVSIHTMGSQDARDTLCLGDKSDEEIVIRH